MQKLGSCVEVGRSGLTKKCIFREDEIFFVVVEFGAQFLNGRMCRRVITALKRPDLPV